MSTPPRGTPARYKRLDLSIPPDLLHRLKLVRAITGINMKEWIRCQLTIAVDLELCQRPGAHWIRPGSRVHRMTWGEGGEPIPVPITAAQGGERVWVREILPEFDLGEDPGLPGDDRYGAVLCDLSAEEEGHLSMRNVLVAVADVQPHAPKWQTGLAVVQARKERERRRRQAALERVRAAEADHPSQP